MDKKKIIIAGLIGAGGVVAWSLFKKSYAAAAEDPWGNPEGTRYDEEGMPELPMFEPGPGEEMTPAEAQGYMTQQRQEDFTIPATEGGLRHHGSSPWFDSRFVAYAQLARPLGAKDSDVYIQDNPNLWVGLSRGSDTPPGQPFRMDQVYRILIEEEPIVVHINRRGGGPDNPKVGRILDRPMMSHWNFGSIPSYRRFDSPELAARWPQYAEVPNPVYPVIRTTGIYGGVPITGGDPIWVNEQRGNCSNEVWAHLGQYRIWDPVLGDCREMTDEERQAHIEWLAAREAEEEAEAAASRAAREADCQKRWGMTCAEWDSIAYQRPAPSLEEAQARTQALVERTRLTMPSDIDQWFPQLGPSGHRAMRFPVDESGETFEQRRQRGRQRYASFDLLMKREFKRDIHSLWRLGLVISGRRHPGDYVIWSTGGFYGLAAIWGEPRRPMLTPTAPRVILGGRTGGVS